MDDDALTDEEDLFYEDKEPILSIFELISKY